MDVNRVDIALDYSPGPNQKGGVLIDGVELKGVRSLTLEAAHDEVTTVTVTFICRVNRDPSPKPEETIRPNPQPAPIARAVGR